jgi:hypothetical protein
MNNTTNPLIGTSTRETIENATEALSAAVVLMADRHSGIVSLLSPVLDALENEGSDRDAIESAAEAFSAAIVLIADKHSDLCRLLMPVLHAIEHASEAMASPETSTATVEEDTDGCSGDPVSEYNRRAAQVRATCEA